MSMNSYPLQEYALLIDEETAARILLLDMKQKGLLTPPGEALLNDPSLAHKLDDLAALYPDYDFSIETAEDLLQNDISFCSEFDGTAETAFSDMTRNPIQRHYDDDYIVYMATEKGPELFYTAYRDRTDILNEFTRRLADMGILMPESYDFWAHIVALNGTYFC